MESMVTHNKATDEVSEQTTHRQVNTISIQNQNEIPIIAHDVNVL